MPSPSIRIPIELLTQSSFSQFGTVIENPAHSALPPSQRNHPPSPVSQQHYYDVERISMRLAHMGVLHWKVWAPILYVRESVSPGDVATRSVSSMMMTDVARSSR